VAVTDLTSDMLTMIRNASRASKEALEIKCSGLMEQVCRIFKDEGFIENYKRVKDNKQDVIKIYLKYNKNNVPAIKGLKRISRPGLRQYKGYRELPKVLGGVGIAIVSTSQGLMTAKEARAKKIGGEVICYAW